ncbi:helix-turn-helix transcriptional regulator [Sphingomonas sp. SAFR-052]|uniref:helix-turn-helix transcriptional regulator n=1 Tax=Sphingomonas sp. SAFR-052 TaxID=3436867 RepID=UPI003F7EF575
MTGVRTVVSTDWGKVADQGSGDPGRDLYWQGRVDQADEAGALFDATGRILRTTPACDALLVTGADGVARWTLLPCEQARIEAALARATARIAPEAAALRYHPAPGRTPLILIARPVPWAMRLLHATPGAAVVSLIDPAERPAPATQLWREAFDLTPSEVALAALLMAGHSLESAAAARDCRQTTLRVHLRHIFAKTGVSRQSDLVSLLTRIGRG